MNVGKNGADKLMNEASCNLIHNPFVNTSTIDLIYKVLMYPSSNKITKLQKCR